MRIYSALLPLIAAVSFAQTAPVLLVANQGERALSVIDPAAGKQLLLIPEGGVTGHEVTVSPDGKTAFVPMYGDSGVGRPGTDGSDMVVIDVASRKVVGRVDFGHGVRPHCPKFNPRDGLLYVTTELDSAVTIVDPRSRQMVGKVPTGAAE